jgi:hypothetical protein
MPERSHWIAQQFSVSLTEAAQRGNNNLDLVRLVLATLVI